MLPMFCPRCHRAVCRLVEVSPAPLLLEQDELLALEGEEVEELLGRLRQKRVRVEIAPQWRSALLLDPERSSNISIGCPSRGCKGKVMLFRR